MLLNFEQATELVLRSLSFKKGIEAASKHIWRFSNLMQLYLTAFFLKKAWEQSVNFNCQVSLLPFKIQQIWILKRFFLPRFHIPITTSGGSFTIR